MPIEPAEGVAPEDAARAGFYALLARVFFAAPDAALLGQIAAAGPIGDAGEESGLPAAWDRLRQAASGCEPAAAQQEFDELFVAVTQPRVALHGSFYLTGSLMETPLAALREDLSRLGLARLQGVFETEDHVAALGEAMRLLILDVGQPEETRLERQREFFQKHIAPWYRDLCAAVEQATGETLYRRIAEFARVCLDVEADSFQIVW
jgi:TorA maturation chaperone TorD